MAVALTLPMSGLAVSACDDDPQRPPLSSSSGGPISPGAGGGGGGGTPGRTDAGVDAGNGCTDLPITGVQILQQIVVGEPQPGTGGALVDGTYDIVDATLYSSVGSAVPGPSGASYQGSMRITNGTFERHVILTTTSGIPVESAVSGTIDLTATTPVINLTCPVAQQEVITYTATDTSLVITNVVSKESLSFTRSP